MGGPAVGWEASSLTPFLAPGGEGHEVIELFGSNERLFGCRHVPEGGGTTGVVICPALFGDAEINYQREARLARWLARAGAAAQRYHPRGTGRSDGSAADVTFASLVDDARQAADLLRERCQVERVAFLGTRAGALIAARAAHDVDDAPLALWQPVVDSRRYVDHSVEVGASVLGTRLGRDLFESGAVDNLVDLVGLRPRPILLVQLHRRVGLASEYRTAVGRWQARGFSVEVAYDPTEDDWWRVHPEWQPSDEVLTVTALWLSSRLAATP